MAALSGFDGQLDRGEQDDEEGQRSALLRLLNQRFGDGSIYLSNAQDRTLLKRAIGLELVSADGFLTPKGYSYRARVPIFD
ncbi:MAG: hypothetical protein KDH88_15760 [Chromatiales bacterium]|nr:hypothetical protein [Chromatiales bacterium]